MPSDAKYYIYRNLHKSSFSIKRRGRVVERPYLFSVENAQFQVSEKSRERAVNENKRNVHAFLVSDNYEIYDYDDIQYEHLKKSILNNEKFEEVTYNPFKYNSFVIKKTGTPVFYAEYVVGIDERIYASGIKTSVE